MHDFLELRRDRTRSVEIAKRVDYLDVFLDLEQDCYEPFSKENNVIKYVHHSSNHPQIILKRIPEIINNRLSRLSSNE